MYVAYVAATLIAVGLTGGAAVLNWIGHSYPRSQADKLRVPRSWMPVLGTLLGAGAAGLLAGFAVPRLGLLAAAGLVVYFLGALGVHVRVRDRGLGGWAMYFFSVVAALALSLAYHGGW